MASFISEGSTNYELVTGQPILAAAVVDTFTVNNGALVVDTDTKWNMGHVSSAGGSNGSLDSVNISATSINGGLTIDGTKVAMVPYTGGSGRAPNALVTGSGNLTVAAAATTGTFATAQTLPAGTKFYTSTGAYIATSLNAIAASTTVTFVAAAVNAQATAAAFFYSPWAQVITDASWSSGVATVTFAVAHGYLAGDWVSIGGVKGADVLDGYNGTFELTSVTSTTISYNVAIDPGAFVKTTGANNLTTSTANATFTWSAAVTVSEGTAIYSSTGVFIGVIAGWVNAATTGTGTAVSAVTQSALPWSYSTGRAIKMPWCDQTQTYSVTAASYATGSFTFTIGAHSLVAGNSVTVAGATPAGYNGTFTVSSVTATTFTAPGTDPGAAYTSGGTTTKLVKSVFLGTWSSFTAGPVGTAATISALGYVKVKSVNNGPFRGGVALSISGQNAATPVATCAGAETTGWIEVVGTETGLFTVPRVATLKANGSWYHPKTLPFTITSSTAAVGNAVTLTTSAHGLVVGSLVTIGGQSVTGLNGTWVVTTVPSTTTFTITDDSFVGLGASTGGFGYGRLTTSGAAQQIIQFPASGGATVGTTNYPGVWVEWNETAATVSAASWVTGTVTFTTTTLGYGIDSLSVGDRFEVVNATPAAYNGKFTVLSKIYATTTTVTITASMANNPGTYTSGGTITSNLTISSATYSAGYVTVTTNRDHGLFSGQTVELDWVNPATYAGVYEIFDVPSTTTFRVPIASDPGTFVSGKLVSYIYWPSAGNITATASAFPVNTEQGRIVNALSGAGAIRFGGDGTNAWGYVPPAGCRVIVPNIVGVNVVKAATTGVVTQAVPSATLTTRPRLTTGGVIGVVSVSRMNLSWYLQAPQCYSFTYNHVSQCESVNFSEVASTFKLNDVGTGVSAIANNQASNLNVSLVYGGGTVSNCTWGKFHNGTANHYNTILTDVTKISVTNDSCVLMRTTASAGGTARNATSGSRVLTRVANSTFTRTLSTGGGNLMVGCANLTFTNNDYRDTNEGATTATTGRTMFEITATSSNITIDGVTFARGRVINTQPLSGLVSVLTGSNNVKLRNVGSVTNHLFCGSANPLAAILIGAIGGAGYNVKVQRVYTTATGFYTGVDNSYSGIDFEDVRVLPTAVYTNISLNTTAKKIGGTNSTTGQTAVYGHHWEDFYTPAVTTVATGTAWANTGIATITTAAAHGLVAGDTVTISSVVAGVYSNNSGYNGTFTILASPAPTATTFAVAMAKNPGAWTSGGSILPTAGKVVLQMNEKTTVEPSNSSYSFDMQQPGAGFTSAGTLALPNVADQVTWTSPYSFYGPKSFTTGTTSTQPTFTSTNPNNLHWFYDLDRGNGFSGVMKNLHFKVANATAGWAVSTTSLTLTPVLSIVTGSISGDLLTVTGVSSGRLFEGHILSGTGITANTVITQVLDAPAGGVGTYRVGIIAFASGTYTVSTSTQTAASTTITGVTSTYGLAVGDRLFDLTTPANITAGTTVASINSATSVTMSASGTTSTLQVLAASAIHGESAFTASGFKMKVSVKVGVPAAANSLTAVAIPTVVSHLFALTQYALDTVNLTLTGLQAGSTVYAFVGTDPNTCVTIGSTDNSSTSVTFQHSNGGQAGYIQILSQGYQDITLPLTYSSSDQTIPIQQQTDRQYFNPI